MVSKSRTSPCNPGASHLQIPILQTWGGVSECASLPLPGTAGVGGPPPVARLDGAELEGGMTSGELAPAQLGWSRFSSLPALELQSRGKCKGTAFLSSHLLLPAVGSLTYSFLHPDTTRTEMHRHGVPCPGWVDALGKTRGRGPPHAGGLSWLHGLCTHPSLTLTTLEGPSHYFSLRP